MSWQCPECGAAAVHSIREVRRVYNWRAIVRPRIRAIAERLRGYRVVPEPDEDATALVKHWVRGGVDDGPGYLCLACREPFASQEVPA